MIQTSLLEYWLTVLIELHVNRFLLKVIYWPCLAFIFWKSSVHTNKTYFSSHLLEHKYNTRNKYILNYPVHSTSAVEKSPLYNMGLRLYNRFPTSDKTLDERSFKSNILLLYQLVIMNSKWFLVSKYSIMNFSRLYFISNYCLNIFLFNSRNFTVIFYFLW